MNGCDIVIAGAGPAGSFAALLLARAGARVRLVDRARFPRDKLCGDTLNPGALRVLAQHLDISELASRALPIDGMLLTGPSGISVRGRYANGFVGRALTRRELDAWLLDRALAAGVQFEDATAVTGPAVEVRDSRTHVTGIRIRSATGAGDVIRAPIVIGADGRRSVLAAGAHLSRQPTFPRRWAVGAYFEGVEEVQSLGEMHVRHGHYIGVAPLPNGLANACLVAPISARAGAWRVPEAQLRHALAADRLLAPRFARARMVTKPSVLGPMAIDVPWPGVPGLLLAGDAAGFIDPMTGDGLRYALVGAEIAASVAIDVLHGRLDPRSAPDVLARRRRQILARKWRFNRVLRGVVASPAAIAGAAVLARTVPRAFEALIRYAGDCGHARRGQVQ
jgi:menaquinone-9 beta-reductase